MERIPFNKACLLGQEIQYVKEAITNRHLQGGGPFTKKSEKLLEESLSAKRVMLTTSGTHALEMAALLLDIGPDDEVIVPSFTHVSTVNAFILHQARPVFCDVRPDTLNLDQDLLGALITPRTKAILAVHYGGVGAEMDRICRIADEKGVAVIEDNAHGLFGYYRDKPLGSIGCLAAQSFHETKNITCGEGGALVINDQKFIGPAEVIRDMGTDRSSFLRGEVDSYTWVGAGSSYAPSDMTAAYLLAQLDARQTIQNKRQKIWERYRNELSDWADDNGVGLPFIPDHCRQTYHTFYLMLPDLSARKALIAHLDQHKISAVFHFQPLHLSPMGRKFGGKPGACPVTEKISERIVRLPFFFDLNDELQDRVIEAILDFQI